jgi:hypothetical protein
VREAEAVESREALVHALGSGAGSFGVPGAAGENAFTFRGRVGGKALKPGSYRLTGQAIDSAGNASPLRRKGFEIVQA